MKICLVSREFPWRAPCGGVGVYTCNMARALAGAGHDVTVVTQSPDTSPHSQSLDSAKVIGLPFRPFPLLPRKLATFSVLASAAWSRLVSDAVRTIPDAETPDIVEAPEMTGEALSLLKHPVRPPVVVKIHSGSSYNLKIRGALRWHHQPLFQAERQSLVRADTVTAVSDIARDRQSEHFQLDLSHAIVAPNPVDTERFCPGDHPPAEPTVLFVGRLDAVKGFDFMPAIIKAVLDVRPDARFVFAGAEQRTVSATEAEPSRAFLMRRLPETHHGGIQFCEAAQDDMPDLYRTAAVVLIPSRVESCPYSGLEAAACAVPVIGTAGTGVECVVADGVTGYLVDPADPATTSARILDLLTEPDKARTMGRAARERIEERYSFDAAARAAGDLYAETVSKASS